MTGRPNILLITTDQQRVDSLGCYGNGIVSTPAIDELAATGIRYARAQPQMALCTPSRSTILTGQHPGTHGVWCNGVALPVDAPSVAQLLKDDGYRTCYIGKLHFEPTATFDVDQQPEGWVGPYRGFDHVETVDHFRKNGHYARWLLDRLGKELFDAQIGETTEVWTATQGGDTGAPQSVYSTLPADLHPSNWAVERVLKWLDDTDKGSSEKPWFLWLSFDDPHHPFNPPASYGHRYAWRDMPLPPSYPMSEAEVESDLGTKPWQYKAWHDGTLLSHEGTHGGKRFRFGPDQVREMTALTYAMVNLIDDAVGRLFDELRDRGQLGNTHMLYTTDHGELLGDHGLIFKGPFHLDGTIHIPLIWKQPDGSEPGRTVKDPVGLVDLAPTIAHIAGVPQPEWMEGEVLPVLDGSRQRVLTVYQSHYQPDLELRTMYRDGYLITTYPKLGPEVGEFYNLTEDPLELENRWLDPSTVGTRDDLIDDLQHNVIEFPEDRLPWLQHA